MASGRINLTTAYNAQSPNCIEAYIDWTSSISYGTCHSVTMKLYAKRKDLANATTVEYGAPSGWNVTTVGTVFSNKAFIHICTASTTVSSNTSGVANFGGVVFYAGFTSSSYGIRRMSCTINSLQLDKPKVSVSISNGYSDGISCSVNNSSPTVGEQITFSVSITNTAKYSGWSLSVSGATLVSGTTYTVTGYVSVTVNASIRSYQISISQTAGITVTVKSGSTSYGNESYVPYGTTISISVSLSNGYDFVGFYVDGTWYALTQTVSVTVGANVTVYAYAQQSGVVYIRDSSGVMNKYQVYIYMNGWSQYKPMIYMDSQWNTCN